MKQIKRLLLILVVAILIVGTNVHAKGNEEYDYYGTFKITDDYLKSKNVKSYEELADRDKKELFEKIDKIKSQNIIRTRSNGDIKEDISYFGDIFVTMDHVTVILRHGHAGIGGFQKGSVIEANKGKGVTLERNGVKNWKDYKSGGIMRVRNANTKDYRTATEYAESKIGYEYSLIPKPHTFYCSELVYYAWKEAGFDICSNKWGTHYSPYDIINDNDTYYVYKWVK